VYIGDTIRAAFSGKVRVVKYDGNGYGKYVVIRHNNGLETIYGHMSKQLVHENQIVRAGTPIGLGGNTGRSTGSHLHFETRLCGVALNPALMFDFRNQDVTGDYYVYRKSTVDSESSRATSLRGVKNGGRYTPEEVRGTSPTPAKAPEATKEKKDEPVALTSGEMRWHVVQAGETLESIARKYGINVERLYRLNNIGPYTTIAKGNQLRYQ
jgi:murein DD-endopeptidase MepM/ murein hydrolase activator NlpD